MLRLMDRQLIRSFYKGFIICLTSLLSLYIVVDLFTNLDDFGKHTNNLEETIQLIGLYYGYKIPQIFDRLFEPILLLAAMFTVGMLQRNNEQLPLLSAGVSTRRIVRPVLLSAATLLSVMVYNQECIIPSIAEKLVNQRDDPDGVRETVVHGAYEPNGVHIVGSSAVRSEKVVKGFCCTIPVDIYGVLLHLEAKEARYVPPTGKPRTGGWELIRAKSLYGDTELHDRRILEPIDQGKYFLYTKRVDFDEITRHQKWYLLASTRQLYEELQEPESERLSAKAVLFHTRFTRPVLAMLLVLLGLGVILRDQNKNVFINAGLCLITCAVFFAAGYVCKMLGDNDLIPPALAAWLPVLLFGPITVVVFDAVHT